MAKRYLTRVVLKPTPLRYEPRTKPAPSKTAKPVDATKGMSRVELRALGLLDKHNNPIKK